VALSKTPPKNQRSFFSIRIPILAVILIIVAAVTSIYFIDKQNKAEYQLALKNAVDKIDGVSMRILVEDEYKWIKPLAFVEFTKEDTLLKKIKADVIDYLESEKQKGDITTASAYIRNLNRHQDARINPSEVYFPGSLMKIPILITYLKLSEKNPAILSQKLTYKLPYSNLPQQNIQSIGIKLGETYSVKDLMKYMIEYSDNNATALLSENIPFEKIAHVFSDLQLPYPDQTKPDYSLTLKDYSRFFRVLFNASYLSWENSEFALDLLTKTDYKTGIMTGIDKGVTVAHKFGERNSDGIQQLHEVGIVYLKERPYLIGVMTKGNNIKKMEQVLGTVSKIVFEGMKQDI
jgi:beta-lactamase class A